MALRGAPSPRWWNRKFSGLMSRWDDVARVALRDRPEDVAHELGDAGLGVAAALLLLEAALEVPARALLHHHVHVPRGLEHLEEHADVEAGPEARQDVYLGLLLLSRPEPARELHRLDGVGLSCLAVQDLVHHSEGALPDLLDDLKLLLHHLREEKLVLPGSDEKAQRGAEEGRAVDKKKRPSASASASALTCDIKHLFRRHLTTETRRTCGPSIQSPFPCGPARGA